MNKRMKEFQFALKCYKAGIRYNGYIKILKELNYLHDEYETTQAKDMLKYYKLIADIFHEQDKEIRNAIKEYEDYWSKK